MFESKIQLAKAQLNEYKALQEFENVASPIQWSTHLILKPKMKLWSIKNKNYQQANKRVNYDLPPKFIEITDLNFKIDETILSNQESQRYYDQMRELTKDYRTRAMTLFVQTVTRERELLTKDIKDIIENFPVTNETEENDVDVGRAAFRNYNELREKRFNLEANQSLYFLEEQRVEGEYEQQEATIAPILTRSLGEDFSLRM